MGGYWHPPSVVRYSRPLPRARAPSRLERMLALLGAFALGCLVSAWWGRGGIGPGRADALTVREERRPPIPTVSIAGIRDGNIRGSIRGDARLFFGETPVLPDHEGAFAVPAAPFLTDHVTVAVPQGMRFVASRRGTYYYPADSGGGARLSPENRVYFETAEDAEGAGFRKAR